MKSEIFVSIVVCADLSTDTLDVELKKLQLELERQYAYFEILVILQGPAGRSLSDRQISDMLKEVNGVRIIQLAYGVHHDVLIAAGLENSVGDFIVIYDPATDPVEVISEAISLSLSGNDVIVGVSKNPPPIAYRILRRGLTRILRIIDYHIPANDTGFRSISRRAANAIVNTGRFYHQLNLRLQKTGYASSTLEYDFDDNNRRRRSCRRRSAICFIFWCSIQRVLCAGCR